MTDSSEESGEGLPTAAEVKVYETENGPHISFTEQSVTLNHGDELVRKSDVKALIQEAVEHELEKARDTLLVVTDKGGGTDRYRERLQQGLTYRTENLDVEELLEELEQ